MTIQSAVSNRIRQFFCLFVVSVLLLVTVPVPFASAEEVPPPTDTTTTTTTEPPAATEVTPTTAPETSTTTPAPDTSTSQGPQQPPGPDSNTYTLNPDTGLWENGTYTWDPNTQQTAPKQAPTYSYNPETGRWDTTEWVYDPPSGTYVPNVVSMPAPPEGAATVNGPEGSDDSPTSDNKPLSSRSLSPSSSSFAPSSSTNDPSDPPKSTGFFDLFHNVSISNTISSLAETGDALVAMNTLAGNALSGSATAIATVINLLQSSWNLLADSFTTFTQNLFGTIVGDLMLNPGSSSGGATALPQDITLNTSQNAAINNQITLEANSGDATVSQNTEAGDATSGDATAIANLINAINSSIVAGQSFLGMLNIFGDLNGDILLPQELTRTLLAANTVGSLDTSQIENSSILSNFDNNYSTTNNVSLDASSGTANVTNNTSAGNATSGSAETNLTVLNLTGRQIIGKNALLVFVNVLGEWVGVIVDAPSGSTTAALGGGISGNTDLTMNTSDTQSVTNDISVGAHTGNATVDSNTTAGNATSGDAKAAVNLLNISGSQFALSDWFGILFINVFGSWKGSFGIDTEAGNQPVVPTVMSAVSGSQSTPSLPVGAVSAFRFVPTSSGSYELEEVSNPEEVLASTSIATETPQKPKTTAATDNLINPSKGPDWLISLAGVMVAASLLGTERMLSRRELKRNK